ncbi:MAG: ABC transporter ATP-binding protein [Geminicoccaceae bacterium]
MANQPPRASSERRDLGSKGGEGRVPSLLNVAHLHKQFGGIAAVQGISFAVDRGEIVGFLGPNGAGKSTTMRMIAGYLRPDAGTIDLGGVDVIARPRQAQSSIGYLPEGAPTYGDMTAGGLLKFVADMRLLNGSRRRQRFDRVIDNLQLASVYNRPVETLSKGFKRRIGLAAAILDDPELLILDEPTDGLDPNQKHAVRTLLQDISKDKAILISTHILEEVEAICGRAIVVAEGRIVADATPVELCRSSEHEGAIQIEVDAGDGERVREILTRVRGIDRVEWFACGSVAELTAFASGDGSIVEPAREAILDNQIRFFGFRRLEGRFDDVFRQLTQASRVH